MLHFTLKYAIIGNYEFQNYALHESTVIVLRFDNTRTVWAQ